MLDNITTNSVMAIAGVILYIHLLHRFSKRKVNSKQPVSFCFYVYKMARITGESEYSIFMKCAFDWQVSRYMVEKDFREYLLTQQTPYYVNDYIRRNKDRIDRIPLPPV